MPKKTSVRIPRGADLTATTAEKIFGWKDIHEDNGRLLGKKQDRAGRWRESRVPDYSNDPRQSYAVDERMRQLGRWERYLKELTKITKAKNLPFDWATPEQRSRAALKALPK
ncbi:MAG TPA: hypothetical protein VH985_18185 [Candidatus Binatia bacterium]|jgi:hypothetical protein